MQKRIWIEAPLTGTDVDQKVLTHCRNYVESRVKEFLDAGWSLVPDSYTAVADDNKLTMECYVIRPGEVMNPFDPEAQRTPLEN